MENKISTREAVGSSLQTLGFGIRGAGSTSKLKFPQVVSLPKTRKNQKTATLTPLGRVIQTSIKALAGFKATPRYVSHTVGVGLVLAVVLTGSTGQTTRLSPLASQGGYGSVLDEAASADVAAKVADQTNLLVASEATSTAQALNSQASIITAGDDTLANRAVVDTAGVVSRDIKTHKVETGDTLATLAAKYNVTTDTVRWANGLKGDEALKVGQKLTILPVSGVQHKLAAGETADSLAAKYQSNAAQIIAFNNAEVTGLKAGDTVVIPDGVINEPGRRPAATQAVASASTPAGGKFTIGGNGGNYAYGYCTYYVAMRRPVPSGWGNAVSWLYNARAGGYKTGSAPAVGAIAWGGGGYYGHVAYVEAVSGDSVTVSEMNYNGNWNRVTKRTVPASSFKYIY
ncbi:MAG TPA: LysM peptidoglycan-binding domain-containing protein [Candidatus Dormibacteraeota bacterium]|nr:LysM peptidoglycan-binding domain-containing protein [Candidatus Dormibacteraeota bacterium]